MNKALATLLLVLPFAAQPALAEDAHHPDQAGQAPAATSAGAAQQGASDREVQALNQQMSKMQALMRQIKRTKNPAERSKLLSEHMAMMRQGMMMMQGMGGGGMMGGMGMMGGGAPQAGGAMSPEMMQQRLELMQNRMDMMQMMMGQMLEQQQAEQQVHKK